MKLGEKIKLLRTEKELTQPELAEKAGIEQSYLSKLENDKGSPSFDIISRIASALDMNGFELVESLSQRYIEESLAHIPEIAAENASIKYKKERKIKTLFVTGALFIVMGVGIFLFFAFKTSDVWSYQSHGIILDGESVMQFYPWDIQIINETVGEYDERLENNRKRIDIVYALENSFKGSQYVMEVSGGRRTFMHDDTFIGKEGLQINVFSISGIVLFLIGAFIFMFNIRFNSKGLKSS